MNVKKYMTNLPKTIFSSIIPYLEIFFNYFSKDGRKYLREMKLDKRDRRYYQENVRDVHGPIKCDNF
jgi:hypothetical protein